MEKSREEKQNRFSKCSSSSNSKRNIWDCGSTLYDSYELNSFKCQIDSAIANSPRTLSMPHFRERCHLSIIQSHPQPTSNKIPRTFQKLFGFIFNSTNKLRRSSNSNSFRVAEKYSKDHYYVVYDKSEPFLSTIPELPQFQISSFVTKSASERFIATTISSA